MNLQDAATEIKRVFLNTDFIQPDTIDIQKTISLLNDNAASQLNHWGRFKTIQIHAFFSLNIHRLQGHLEVTEFPIPTFLNFKLEIEDMRQVSICNEWNSDVVEPCLSGNLSHMISRFVEVHIQVPEINWKKEGF